MGSGALFCWQKAIDCFYKLKDSAPMRRAYSERLGESEAGKVRGENLVFGRIYLVNHENHTLAPSSQPLGKVQIQRRKTMLAVDHKKEQIGAFDGDLRGGVRLLSKVWIRARTDAAGVNYLEPQRCGRGLRRVDHERLQFCEPRDD